MRNSWKGINRIPVPQKAVNGSLLYVKYSVEPNNTCFVVRSPVDPAVGVSVKDRYSWLTARWNSMFLLMHVLPAEPRESGYLRIDAGTAIVPFMPL